jgi:tetratricopeptide (TPR) repeat protein
MIFPDLPAMRVNSLVDFIGRDQDLLGRIDLGSAAVEARLQRIQQAEQKYQNAPQKSRDAMSLGTTLLDLYAAQAMYLENLRGLGLSDKRYPDISHFITVWRKKVISLGRKLADDFPQSALTRRWRVAAIESAMRTGDDSVHSEVAALAKRDPRASDTVRLRALGAGLTETRATSKNYGTAQAAVALDPDSHSSAALKLIMAEAQFGRNKAAAMVLYKEAAREGLGIKRPGGAAGPITSRAASRLVEQALASKPKQPNPEIVSFLESMGLPGHLKFYLERCAVANLPSGLAATLEGYDYVASLGVTNAAEKHRINLRTLDLVLAAGNVSFLDDRWSAMAQNPDKMRDPEVGSRMQKSQALVWGAFQKRPSPGLAEQLTRLHDGFERSSPTYAADTVWKIRVLEALFKSGSFQQVSNRADKLARELNDKSSKTAALRYSARAKEKILGITDSPRFEPQGQPSGDSDLVLAYIGVLRDLEPQVSGDEREKAAYQAAYLSYVVKGRNSGKAEFTKKIGEYPKSKLAPTAANFLLADAISNQDHAFVESLGRSLEKWKIRPSDKSVSNLRAIIETAVFEQAKDLAEQSQHSPAADKFVAFQKEFPRSKNADIALHQASRNYTSAKQIDKSVAQMERLLESYPSSTLAKETRWSAAEQSKSIGQLLRAANHYSAFAGKYRADGYERKAWLVAAELHKGLGRFSHSISSYEQHLNAATRKDDKVAAAKEIASMQQKFGSAPEALASFDRVIKMAPGPADEVWARFHVAEILLRQGDEAAARDESKKLFVVSASDDVSRKYKTKIRYSIAKLDASALIKRDPMMDAKLLAATQAMVKEYDAIKKELMSPCEVPRHEYCAVGYFETAKLAEAVAERLLDVRPPPTIDPAEAGKVTSLVRLESQRLSGESKAYAAQAEASLNQGAPDPETAELIRSYSQRVQGRDPLGLPD